MCALRVLRRPIVRQVAVLITAACPAEIIVQTSLGEQGQVGAVEIDEFADRQPLRRLLLPQALGLRIDGQRVAAGQIDYHSRDLLRIADFIAGLS